MDPSEHQATGALLERKFPEKIVVHTLTDPHKE